MTLRNLLNPGDFVFPVPVGIRTTLQYNVSGNLEKVYVGYNDMREDVTDKIIDVLLKNHTVPSTIHVKTGTSWVKGVLYTSELLEGDGVLPYSVEKRLLDLYAKKPSQFNFFAHSISSTSTVFRGVLPVKQSLAISKFKVLHGWVVPNVFDDTIVDRWVNDDLYPFRPFVTDLVIYRGNDVQYMSNRVSQFTVLGVKTYIDDNGYFKAALKKEGDNKHFIDYSDLVKWDIRPLSQVMLDANKQIIYVKQNGGKSVGYKASISCPYCGRLYSVPESGLVQCPNIHCTSRLLSYAVNFATVMQLPNSSVSIVREWIREKRITCVPDILILDEYKNIKRSVDVSNIFRSLIPTSYIVTDDVFKMFVLGCGSNRATVDYYINNPYSIRSDLKINHPDLNKLVDWLSDGCNASDLLTLLDSEQLEVTWNAKKFDGAPIFRGKTIYITGEFIHGTAVEISEILESYSAKVVTKLSEDVNCVIVGGTHDGADGRAINSARAMGVPVFEEDVFFSQYEIDDDLRMCGVV